MGHLPELPILIKGEAKFLLFIVTDFLPLLGPGESLESIIGYLLTIYFHGALD